MARVEFAAVVIMVRILQRAGIVQSWEDFLRAYKLPDMSTIHRSDFAGGYSGPPDYMERLRRLHIEHVQRPEVARFFQALAEAILFELDSPGLDILGRRGKALELVHEDIQNLKDLLLAWGFTIDDSGVLREGEAEPASSDIDAVTGIPLRRYLDVESERIMQQAKSSREPIAAMFIDTDDFGQFNKAYSHQVGDRVLRDVAQAAASAVGRKGVIGRYGQGDEIVATLRNLTEDEAYALAERIRKAVEAIRLDDLHVTVSIGVASIEEGSISTLWEMADGARQAAKDHGKNRTVKFTTKLN